MVEHNDAEDEEEEEEEKRRRKRTRRKKGKTRSKRKGRRRRKSKRRRRRRKRRRRKRGGGGTLGTLAQNINLEATATESVAGLARRDDDSGKSVATGETSFEFLPLFSVLADGSATC